MASQPDPNFIDRFNVPRRTWTRRLGLDAPINLAFLLLLTLAGVGGWLAHYHTQILYESQAHVTHSYRLLGQLQRVMATAIDAETGARGYIATGLDAYLDPYFTASKAVESRLAELSLLADDQPEAVATLSDRLDAHFVFLDRVVTAGVSGEKEAAIEALRSGDGKRLMDAIRETTGEIEAQEVQLLSDRQDLARNSFTTARLTGMAVAISSVLLIAVAYVLVRRFELLRDRSTREIADARERFEVVLDSIGDSVIVTDPQGRLAYCNDGCRSTLKFSPEDLGRPLDELFLPAEAGEMDLYQSTVRRAIDQGGIHRTTGDAEFRLSDGTRIPIDATAARIQSQDGTSQGVVLVLRDTSIRRERERDIVRSNERFRSLVMVTSQIVWTTDSDGTVREDSPSWRAYTGQTYEQWKGLGQFDAIHPDDREHTLAEWQAAISHKRPFSAEYRLRRADGSYGWNMARAVPVRDSDGTIREWVGMSHDIEARKRSEESQRDESRRKDEFIALLAHELRNPLAPLRNGLEVLKLGVTDDSPRALAMMDRQVQHMIRLIDDLLDVSRIGQGKLELRLETVDLRDVLRGAFDAVEPWISAKRQILHVSLPESPVWVRGDTVRLNQVVTNLLTNAIKYSGERASIWVTAEREGSSCLISVRDSGQGIPTELRPRIWDLFRQGAGSIERAEGGLGIGLTLVKQLVELHDGQVDVHSEGLGAGSEFTVRLPSTAAPAQTVVARPVTARVETRVLRVLVIDDNEDSAESAAMLLRLGGHEVRTAFRGEAGIVEFSRFEPGLVLCDIRMPDMTGYDVARRLRSLPSGRSAVLVALTGFGTALDRDASFRAGFDRHFVKPVDPDALTELLREVGTRPHPQDDGAA